jgi:hypothetical protein
VSGQHNNLNVKNEQVGQLDKGEKRTNKEDNMSEEITLN